jgi:hypothetical protein
MATKPQQVGGYTPELTAACERVLVILLRGFGTLKEELRLIGGLVPQYLAPARDGVVPASAGTSDVDIVLDLQVLADPGAYRKIAKQFKDTGFQRYRDAITGQISSWQWVYQLNEKLSVMVEFLADTGDADPGLEALKGEGISAARLPFVGIARDWYSEHRVTVDIGGAKTTEEVRCADATAFIVLKAIAFEHRNERKDAADLYHVMRYADETETLAAAFVQRWVSGQHTEAVETAITVLKTRFVDGDGVKGYERDGPVACARFSVEGEDADALALYQREVSGAVTEFLALVEAHRDRLLGGPQ